MTFLLRRFLAATPPLRARAPTSCSRSRRGRRTSSSRRARASRRSFASRPS